MTLTWVGGADDTTNVIYGEKSRRVTCSGSHQMASTYALLSPHWDLSLEGRFGPGDYTTICIFVHDLANVDAVFVQYGTKTEDFSNMYLAEWTQAQLVEGWNYLKVKKSDMTTSGSPDWSDTTLLRFLVVGSTGAYVSFSCWMIDKADPDDPATFNDTGPIWDFDGGYWHVVEGNVPAEPRIPIVLAGARDPKWRVVIRGNRYLARHWVTADYGVAALYSVSGLVAAKDRFEGLPVYLTHDSQDIVIDDEEGRRRVLPDPWPPVTDRSLLGHVRGPVTWDDSTWELRATIEPIGPQEATTLDAVRRSGWGFSMTTGQVLGRTASNGEQTVDVLEVFFGGFTELCCVQHPSLGGRFLGSAT